MSPLLFSASDMHFLNCVSFVSLAVSLSLLEFRRVVYIIGMAVRRGLAFR